MKSDKRIRIEQPGF